MLQKADKKGLIDQQHFPMAEEPQGNNVITLDFLMQQQNEGIEDKPEKKKKKKKKEDYPSQEGYKRIGYDA
jgi:hypothetical protein